MIDFLEDRIQMIKLLKPFINIPRVTISLVNFDDVEDDGFFSFWNLFITRNIELGEGENEKRM